MSRLCYALLLGLFTAVVNLSAAGLPIVLSSQVRLQLQGGGLRAQVLLDTHSAEPASLPFPAVSGAGALLSWSSEPAGRYSMVDPTGSAPGAPAYIQQTAGRGQLVIDLWQPLPAGESEVVLRLPPTPNGRWLFRGLPEEIELRAGEKLFSVDAKDQALEGEIPGDGLLWLSWGGEAHEAAMGYLESSDLELRVEAEKVRFRARLKGYQPQRELQIKWSPEMVFDPGDEPKLLRTRREDGVDVHGLTSDWFDEVFEGVIHFREGDTSILLPSVRGLARPAQGEIRIVPVAARRFRALGQAEVHSNWSVEAIAKGVERLRLLPNASVRPLKFRISGDVPARGKTTRVSRITVRTEPSLSDDFLLSSDMDIRVDGPGEVALGFPETVRILRAKFAGQDLLAGPNSLPTKISGGEGIGLDLKRNGVLRLRLDHNSTAAIPRYGDLKVQLPRVGGGTDRIQWSGRLPEGLALVQRKGGADVPFGRRPFPLRWMDSLFEGTRIVLEEAGVVVAFGLALLLGLYASLFLQSPNKQSVYVLAFGVAVFGLLFNFLQAAESAPRAGARLSPGAGMMGPLAQSLHDSKRHFTQLLSPTLPGSGPSHSPPRGEQAPGARGRLGGTPVPPLAGFSGSGGRTERGLPGLGMFSQHGPNDGHGHPGSLSPAASPSGVPQPEPIPDDWNLTLLPGAAGSPIPSLDLVVVASRVPRMVSMFLALLVLAAVGLSLVKGGNAPLVMLLIAAGGMLPLDLCFGRDAASGLGLALAILLAVTLHRMVLEGLAMWEKLRTELENRRLQALARPGKSGSSRDTGGGLYSGAKLQKNEASYEDVYRDDEGITFIMGEG